MAVNRVRTIDQVLSTLNAYFDTNVPNVLRQEGTVPQDQIDTQSTEFQNLYNIMTFVKESQTISGFRRLIASDSDSVAFRNDLGTAMDLSSDQVSALISAAIDDMAADPPFDLTRKQATKATLILRFLTPSSFNASVPIGTAARTPGLNSIEYKTTVNILNQPVTLDPQTGLYYIDVPAEATLPGTGSIVPINRVTDLTPPISGFNTVTNISSSSGGTDTESDSDFLDRMQNAAKASQLDTKYGLEGIVKEQSGVVDAIEVGNESPLMTRGVGNQVDIWELGTNEVSAQDTVTYNHDTMNNEIILSKQPVGAITFVSVNGNPYTINVQYAYIQDDQGFSHSARAIDRIQFLPGFEPIDGEQVIIQYTYNKLVSDIQNVLAETVNEIPNSDILIREALEVLIDMTIHIVLFPGYSQTDVQTAITTAIENFINGKKLAGSLSQSDLVGIIEDTAGVDRVDIPFTILDRTPGTGSQNELVIQQNEYPRLNTLTFA